MTNPALGNLMANNKTLLLLVITTLQQMLVKMLMQMVKRTFHLKVFYRSSVKSGQMKWKESEV